MPSRRFIVKNKEIDLKSVYLLFKDRFDKDLTFSPTYPSTFKNLHQQALISVVSMNLQFFRSFIQL